MKKTISLLGATLFLALTLSFNAKASDINGDVNSQVKNSFTRYFTAASHVNWYNEKGNNYMARFYLGDTKMTAYFGKKGHLLLTSRAIEGNQLPLKILQHIREKYAGNTIRYVTELAADNATNYVITLESATHWTQLKTDVNGDLIVMQKLKKA